MDHAILFLGEAWGEAEARCQKAFVGASGVELLNQLHMAGVITLSAEDRSRITAFYRTSDGMHTNAVWQAHSSKILRTNVFNQHPPGNNLELFCGSRAEGIPDRPALVKGKYVRAGFASELNRLSAEIEALRPNLIVCLGNTALWAMTGTTAISKVRGTTMLSTRCVPGVKLLPTYHPSAVMREWTHRPTVIADLTKARIEAASPTLRRPECEIWLEPTIADILDFHARYIAGCDILSVDIETAGSAITCIGFAPSTKHAIVIPFEDTRKPDGNYWSSPEDELKVWHFVKTIMENRSIPKLFQNGLYDIAFLLRSYGIRTFGARHDTMLLSHSLQPEMLKGLGYLGSIYSDFSAWKQEHKMSATIKRDD